MAGSPKRRARKILQEKLASQYVTDDRALARAYREYSLTGVLEDPWTGERYCPSCEKPEDYCDCGECA